MDYSIIYRDPTVNLIDHTDPNRGYNIWKESKSAVVKSKNGRVSIGNDDTSEIDYYRKIMKMNMQYNNVPYFIFEIDGSILFRDLLYNINSSSQWAVSLRLMHSVYDRTDINNYVVSSEYKGIKEWEDAFDSYYKVVLEDDHTDRNRITMPYSIRSKYWVGMNYKSLVNLLSMLKFRMPFFYEIYGKQMEDAYNNLAPFSVPISDFYSRSLDSGYLKYFSNPSEKFEEKCVKVDDYYLVKQSMSLILYSQFIRQASTDVRGLYDLLSHDNPDEFKHQVFTGDTLINVTYLAHESRVMKTLSNRTCWFSQSDGDENDPHYWSKFINTFMSGVETPEDFKKLLPCKFCQDQLVDCKYKEDVKFRDQGLQAGYIPCAILNKSMEFADARYEECPNKLNNWYRVITKDIINKSYKHRFSTDAWTSDLVVLTDSPIEEWILSDINQLIAAIKMDWDRFKSGFPFPGFDYGITDYEKYWLNGDPTCMLKGLLINELSNYLVKSGHESFLISFGGDIYGHNAKRSMIKIEGTRFSIDLEGTYSVFTSGNTEKRGDHIIGGPSGMFNTVVVQWGDAAPDNSLVDILATKLFANELDSASEIESKLGAKDVVTFRFLEDGRMMDHTYCASPFFNENQIAIRDKMVTGFIDVFRPDLTDVEAEYGGNKDDSFVEKVVDANISGIESTENLVFPSSTTDLGTLYEVGYAIAVHHPIIKYNEMNDDYIIEPFLSMPVPNDVPTKFECNKKLDAIAIGFASKWINDGNIYYVLNGCPDNIMLSVRYTHIEKVNGKYIILKRDPNERDQ